MTVSSNTTPNQNTAKNRNKDLEFEVWKLKTLSRMIDKMWHHGISWHPEGEEERQQSDQISFLLITLKDLVAGNEDDFLETVGASERKEEEDTNNLLSLWSYLEEHEKKHLMACIVSSTQKAENEDDSLKPGNWFYDLRRSLAKEYGVDIRTDSNGKGYIGVPEMDTKLFPVCTLCQPATKRAFIRSDDKLNILACDTCGGSGISLSVEAWHEMRKPRYKSHIVLPEPEMSKDDAPTCGPFARKQ